MNVSRLSVNLFDSKTDLCEIGSKYGTDKTPYNNTDCEYYNFIYRHSYTPFYSTLFSNIRYNKINFGEIGILCNASMKMWREYFPKAKLYGWDGSEEHLKNAKNDNLKNVIYDYMHTSYEETIQQTFSKCNCKFDVLIDDASHLFWDQMRLIRNCVDYLKPGAFLIIEDIDRYFDENLYVYEVNQYGHDKYFNEMIFVDLYHNQSSLDTYDNDKIIVFTRSNFS
jgi:SAM-dependent methyltransferase